jgi:hypothetical protein
LVSLFQVTLVPTFTQKEEFPFAPGMLGVAEAAWEVRLTSTEHGSEDDPHVVAAVQSAVGSGSRQAYAFFFCAWADSLWASKTSGNAITANLMAQSR